jgi:hypothetical protein
VSRAEEERAYRRLAEEKDQLQRGARELRRVARQDAYAGIRGDFTANALAALLESVQLHWTELPVSIRSDALAAARYLLDGPDGHHDPRPSAGREAIQQGDGH